MSAPPEVTSPVERETRRRNRLLGLVAVLAAVILFCSTLVYLLWLR